MSANEDRPTFGNSPDVVEALQRATDHHSVHGHDAWPGGAVRSFCGCNWAGPLEEHAAHQAAAVRDELREAGWVLVRADDVLTVMLLPYPDGQDENGVIREAAARFVSALDGAA